MSLPPPPGDLSPHDDTPSDSAGTLRPSDTSRPNSTVAEPPRGALHPDGPVPQPFGRYVVRQRLGYGGMATVYLADDTRLQIEVALKVPHPHLLDKPAMLQRFYREARAAARLDHPNVCRIFDVGELQRTHYLSMAYVRGTPLAHGPPGEPWQAAELVRKLALVLAEAHRLGVVHRDLKPANVLINQRGEPVVMDFGLALCSDPEGERLTQVGALLGTPAYMAPEQFRCDPAAMGPACDVYSLGVILYELLTARRPFEDRDVYRLYHQVQYGELLPRSAHRPGLDPVLEAVCLQALARLPEDRFASMDAFAAALGEYLTGMPAPSRPPSPPSAPPRPAPRTPTRGPLLAQDAFRFAFVGVGERAPPFAGPQDRLFLDVGNDLRPGVIDHHHLASAFGSTASLVLAHPDLVEGAVPPQRRPDAPFTFVLHEKPDLDSVVAAYLARACLTTGSFPPGAEALARYVDKVDEGSLGMCQANPYSLYAAYLHLTNRHLRRTWGSEHERWQEGVRGGLEVTAYAVGQMVEQGIPLPAVDAFACPSQFHPADRDEVRADLSRYRGKLADPRTHARQIRLRLPGQFGGTVEAEALLVRDVQNADDPERCVFFKDWARTDAERCPNGQGFVALSVFVSESLRQVRRCVLSVTPASGTSLRGLGELLDQAEAERRRQIHGVDDREADPATGAPKPPRPGYANADPWYDGRAHGYTIVDAPRS